jgi:hypothetical protein
MRRIRVHAAKHEIQTVLGSRLAGRHVETKGTEAWRSDRDQKRGYSWRSLAKIFQALPDKVLSGKGLGVHARL